MSARLGSPVAAAGLAALLLICALPCASHLHGEHPAWSVALLLAAGAVHALSLAAAVIFAGSLGRFAGGAAAALLAAFVAADARVYGLVGLHVDRSTFGNALEPQAAATLGLTPADLIPVLLAAVLAAALLLAARRPGGARAAAGACAFLALDLLLAIPLSLARFEGIQPLVGLADAMPLSWSPRPETLYARLLGHPPLAVDDDLLFPLHAVSDNVLERLVTRPLPAGAARRPDILVITVESLRADALAAMPSLLSLWRQSLRGERHYGAGNCSFLSNFSLLTGLSPSYWRVGETWRAPLGLGAFAALGYDVEVKSSAALNFGVTEAALPPGTGQRIATPALPPDQRDDENARWAAAWARAPRTQPSLALLFLDASHWPYYGGGTGPPPFATSDTWALRRHAAELHQRYLASLAAIDGKLATVFAALRESGRLESTVIVALGDHGEAFREHGVFSHGSRVDEEQILVPLLIKLPGIAPGSLPGPSTHADVLPTLLGYLGAAPLAFGDGLGIDLRSGAACTAPPLVGSCGINMPTGYAALDGERKILFQLYDGAAHFIAVQATDGTTLPVRGDDPTVRAVLAAELRASRALLLPR